MSYMVTRRTREIGLRMALGASRGAVLRLVLAEVLLVVGVGIAVALAATIPLGRIARASEILFGVKPNDPAGLAGATLLLLVVPVVAGVRCSGRAARRAALAWLR